MSLFRATFCTTPDGKPVSCLEGIPVTYSCGLLGSSQVKVTVPVHANLAPEFDVREHTRPLYYSVAVERQSLDNPDTWVLVEAGIIVNTHMDWQSGELEIICSSMIDLLKKRVLTDNFASDDWNTQSMPYTHIYPESNAIACLLTPIRGLDVDPNSEGEGNGWPGLHINYRGASGTYGGTYRLNEFYNTYEEFIKLLDQGYAPDLIVDARWWTDNSGTDESYRRNRTRTLWDEGRLQYQGIVGNDEQGPKHEHAARNQPDRPYKVHVGGPASEASNCTLEIDTSELYDEVGFGGPLYEVKEPYPHKERTIRLTGVSDWNALARPMFTIMVSDEQDDYRALQAKADAYLAQHMYPQLTFSVDMLPGLEKTLYWKGGDWIQLILDDETVLPNAKQLVYNSRIMVVSGDGEGKLSLQIDPVPEERGL